MKTIVDRFQLQ